MIDHLDVLDEFNASGMKEKDFWRAFYPHLSYATFHGRLWRARQGMEEREKLYAAAQGTLLTLEGDWIIVGDVQLPTTNYEFAALPAAIAKRHLKKPRQLAIVGDLMNMDSFSAYANEIGMPSFRQEVESARALIRDWRRVFDRIVWLPGNHERRISRLSGGSVLMDDLRSIIDVHIETSDYDRAIIKTPTGDWLIAHGSNYSVNQLTVVDQLAQKYRRHVIGHHQHHCAAGWDRYKHNVVVDNGGLFNDYAMAYCQLNTSKSPVMQRGFTMLRRGYPYVFSESPMTDWDYWLGTG